MSGRKIWMILLAVFLVVYGLLLISNIRFEGQNLIVGVLAIAAGILLVFDR